MTSYSGKLKSKLGLTLRKWSRVLAPLAAPSGADTLAMAYVRVGYELNPNAAYGYIEVRAVRPDGDSTAYQGYVVPAPDPSKPGGTGSFPITQLWVGANPGSLSWDVRAMQGVRSAWVTTRYSKTDAQ